MQHAMHVLTESRQPKLALRLQQITKISLLGQNYSANGSGRYIWAHRLLNPAVHTTTCGTVLPGRSSYRTKAC